MKIGFSDVLCGSCTSDKWNTDLYIDSTDTPKDGVLYTQ